MLMGVPDSHRGSIIVGGNNDSDDKGPHHGNLIDGHSRDLEFIHDAERYGMAWGNAEEGL
jgi:hypothetical protein